MDSSFELTYIHRAHIHEGRDAAALYFRATQGGRYIGAFAGAVGGPDLVAFGPKPRKPFWAALAYTSCNAIGARLVVDPTPRADPHLCHTIWIKATDVRAQMDDELALPVIDEVFRTFSLDVDVRAPEPRGRILSVGSSSISLRAAGSAHRS